MGIPVEAGQVTVKAGDGSQALSGGGILVAKLILGVNSSGDGGIEYIPDHEVYDILEVGVGSVQRPKHCAFVGCANTRAAIIQIACLIVDCSYACQAFSLLPVRAQVFRVSHERMR